MWYEYDHLQWRQNYISVVSDHSTFYLYEVMNQICINFCPEENIGAFPTTNETDVRTARFGGRYDTENAANLAWEHYFPEEDYSISGLFPGNWHRLLPFNTTYFDDASALLSSLTWQIKANWVPDTQGRYRKTYDVYNIRGN